MSLLLDALRRAAATKQGPQADRYTVPRRSDSEPERPQAGSGDADDGGELTLEPEIAEAEAGPPSPDRGPAAVREDEPSGAAPAEASRRAAAHTLAGGRRGRPAQGRPLSRSLLGGLALVAVLAAVAGGGWWYYQESQRASRADLAAYQPTAEPLVEGDSIEPAASGSVAAEPAPSGAPAAGGEAAAGEQPDGTEPATGDEAAAGDGAAADQAVAAEAGAAEAAASDPAGGTTDAAGAAAETGSGSASASATRDARSTAKETAAARSAATGGDGASAAAAEPARRAQPLVRATGPSELARNLQAGYAALRAGDLEAAARGYGRALELDPHHRDALLGAASIAQRRGDPERAASLYRRVLSDRPRDEYARAALAGLQGASAPRRSETELKRLLRARPDSPSLQFALGNLYAAESRWAEAQSAYFEAYRAAPREPDYAYNLAVALDHLGKRDAARDFYRKALAAGDGSGAQFPAAAARRRLEQLQ